MTLAVGDPIQYAPVTRPYRRWLAWALALLLHLALIGVVASWQIAAPPLERSSLDVVLVTRPAEAPVNADAIADADQQAAGTQQEETSAESRAAPVEAPATTQQGAREDESATPAPPESAERVASEAPPVEEAPPTPREAPQATTEAEPRGAAPTASGRDLLADATRSIREQGLAPTSRGIDSAAPRQAAQRAAEARYIDDWTRRVETYGNRVHPAPRHLQGQLRIRVVVGRGGELRQAEVVQSSGHPELDQAALDTVHGAAPYRPFDAGMGSLDSLSITRVWRFGQGNNYGVR